MFLMLRRPPRATRTDTLFPYTTLFRSAPEQVDQVILGCVGQVMEDGYIARHAAVKAGLPIEVPAYTVNRICGSGLEAINRSEEHTSELQSLMRISYAVFCLKKKKT